MGLYLSGFELNTAITGDKEGVWWQLCISPCCVGLERHGQYLKKAYGCALQMLIGVSHPCLCFLWSCTKYTKVHSQIALFLFFFAGCAAESIVSLAIHLLLSLELVAVLVGKVKIPLKIYGRYVQRDLKWLNIN